MGFRTKNTEKIHHYFDQTTGVGAKIMGGQLQRFAQVCLCTKNRFLKKFPNLPSLNTKKTSNTSFTPLLSKKG